MAVKCEVASRDHTFVGPLWKWYHRSRRCSRDTYPESFITKYTSVRRQVRGGGLSAVERGKNNLNGVKDFHLKNGSSQGQNLALTVLYRTRIWP